jgi:hypothetical protein
MFKSGYAPGGQVTEHLRGALRLSVQNTLGLTSTHYILDFGLLWDGSSFLKKS